MQGKRLKASLIASLAILALAGCGASPTQQARPAGASSMGVRTMKTAPANPDEQDISKNPFVIWIKQNHPKAAATIINQYLSSEGPPNANPGAEGDRVLLRRQAIDTVAKELLKNMKQGLPQGLVAKVAEPGHVRVSGYQRQFGFKINLQFDFIVQMDTAGMIWIKVPKDLVKATADSAILRLVGGDLNSKAYDEIIKEVDKQGPPNVRKTPGLKYTKGGTFRVDPGFAFVNMPA
jgi:hypothetical protein